MLTRTDSGLNNLHLLYKVDAVVFVEGGSVESASSSAQEGFVECSDDIKYWRSIFNVFRPDKQIKFIPLGAKKNVKVIAEKIESGVVTNAIAAMDRDFDSINGQLIMSNNVLYTYGYSWENDAWNKYSVIKSFCDILGVCETTVKEYVDELDEYIIFCHSRLCRFIRLDAVLIGVGSSFFDRKNYKMYVSSDLANQPIISKESLRRTVRSLRQDHERPIVNSGLGKLSLFDCFGHLYEHLLFTKLLYFLRMNSKHNNFRRDMVVSIVIGSFERLLGGELLPEVKTHYELAFNRVLVT